MKQIVSDAIVLRRINYGEADRILTALTKEFGKVVILARGVRKPKSKLAGGIELMSTNQITFIKGRGDISTLISARLKKHYGSIVTDLDRTNVCYEFIKLINKSVEDDSGEEFYDLLEDSFDYLDDITISLGVIRLWFGLQFLALMGHAPSADIDRTGDHKRFRFDLDKMTFVSSDSGPYEVNDLKLFKLAIESSPKKLSRVTDIDNLIQKQVSLMQSLMVGSGFSRL